MPNRPRLLSIIIYAAGYTQLVGRLVHGDPWAIKVGLRLRGATQQLQVMSLSTQQRRSTSEGPLP